MAEWYDQPLELVRVLVVALRNLGSDELEHRLKTMAEACRRMQTSLQMVDRQLEPLPDLLRDWEGDEATVFREKWEQYLDPKYRRQAIQELGTAEKILDKAADMSHETKVALRKLIQSILVAVAASVAISAMTAGIGALAGWARTAEITAEVAMITQQTLSRWRLFLNACASLLRFGAINVGRSRALLMLAPQASAEGGSSLFWSAAWKSFKSYWQVHGGTFTINYGISGTANTLHGHDFFDGSLLSMAQASNSSLVSGAAGGLGTMTFFAKHPYWGNALLGASSAGGLTLWNDLVEKKPAGTIAWDLLKVAPLSGGLTAVYVKAGQTGVVKKVMPSTYSHLPPFLQAVVVGFPGNVTIRTMVPWARKPPPLDVPAFPPLPGNENSPG